MTPIRDRLAQLLQPLIRGRRGLFKAHYLSSLGFRVKTVFDIGVYRGTPHLYEAFPDSVFVLVDPLRNCESLLEHPQRRNHFVDSGLASIPGTLTLTEQASGKTSFLEHTALTAEPIVGRYEVTVTTLDLLFDSLDIEALIELFYLAVRGVSRKWKNAEREWTAAMTQFAMVFGDRCSVELRKQMKPDPSHKIPDRLGAPRTPPSSPCSPQSPSVAPIFAGQPINLLVSAARLPNLTWIGYGLRQRGALKWG